VGADNPRNVSPAARARAGKGVGARVSVGAVGETLAIIEITARGAEEVLVFDDMLRVAVVG